MEFHPAFAGPGQYHPEYGQLPAQAEGLTLEHFPHDVPPEAIEPYTNAHGHLTIPVAGSYQELQTVFADGGTTFSVSALYFDPFEELLWMGNQGGHVTSYYGSHLQKYSSFQAHSSQQEIRQLLALDSGIISLARQGLRCNSRQGIKLFDYNGSAMEEMRAMIILKDSTRLLAGGQQEKLVEIDLKTGEEKGLYDCGEEGITIMRMSNSYLCRADTTGKIHLCDPSSMEIQHTLEAHSTSVSDFDVHENQLVSCGFSTRHGNYSLDRYLMVFDLRMMRAMPPFHIPIEALFVRYVPTYSNRVIAMSQTGHFQLVDPGGLMTAEDIVLYQVNIAGDMLMCMDVCSTYHSMVFGDVAGYVHLWADAEEVTFNQMSRDTNFASSVDPIPSIDINNSLASLFSIPLPFPANDEPLLSDWPAETCRPVHRQTIPVDPQILSTMKVVDFIGYAPKSGSQKRNQVAYPEVLATLGGGTKELIPESPIGRGEDLVQCIVPKKYRKVEIKYSGKFGVDDFNFRHYNSTNFAGLEPHIPNAYCNSMLQVLHFIEPLRVALQSHLCEKEFCLACEMGFLFYMLDHCKGQTCQASNFLRAFRTIPEGSALGLLLGDAEESTGKANFPRLIQSWNRFVLQQIVQETNIVTKDEEGKDRQEPSAVGDMFEAQVHTKSRCRSCSQESERVSASSVVTLNYPSVAPGKAINKVDFVTVLQKSMCSDQSTYTFCEDCKKYQPSVQTRSYQRLQDVIAINCHIETQGDEMFWRKQLENDSETIEETIVEETWVKPCKFGDDCTRSDCKFGHGGKPVIKRRPPSMSDSVKWVPLKIYMRLKEDGMVDVKEFPDDKSAEEGYLPYSLHASLVHVVDPKTGGNLLAHINVGNTYHKRKEGVTHSQWYLFNDFSIESIDKLEAIDFNMDWKVPCILYFVNSRINEKYDLEIHNPNEVSILQPRASLAEHSFVQPHMTFTPLGPGEAIKEGDLVGLDAEFVSLNKEEAEIRSDGTRSTIKPSQMSVARITCVRGGDEKNMVAFIDDYISTQEQVVDYLTRFSGIHPGDLDATLSQKHLTTLKVTYLKLRHLVDCGATFVGHGLRKDFRVINLLVSHNKIIDTAHLYNLPTQRIVSLRFLAWYFLGLRIQSETHDSTEDACTAVKLYHYYLNHSNGGLDEQAWQEKLKALYEEGRKLKWKVPPP
ncbi:PAN2-PAN3 deadenylation complex catalytic subunit PAN2-like isoform X2 [Apostichopus japonicus]|uniref:PAN2-PAN3 deadenylation complex catalytic subunit PAN2-like isoform X2 n=1 Tax=Stichopus japonicus TaxID=307972 RepID=UPI003AB71FBA